MNLNVNIGLINLYKKLRFLFDNVIETSLVSIYNKIRDEF
jgi:hypothetical protein